MASTSKKVSIPPPKKIKRINGSTAIFFGLSTDDKGRYNMKDGDIFEETDTKQSYRYNNNYTLLSEENQTLSSLVKKWEDKENIQQGEQENLKYKPKDTVKVRKDLEIGKYYDDQLCTEAVMKFLGEELTIKSIVSNYPYKSYYIVEGFENYAFTDEMLEHNLKEIL